MATGTYEAYHPGVPVHQQVPFDVEYELPSETNLQAQNNALEELQAQNRELLMRLTALEQDKEATATAAAQAEADKNAQAQQ